MKWTGDCPFHNLWYNNRHGGPGRPLPALTVFKETDSISKPDFISAF